MYTPIICIAAVLTAMAEGAVIRKEFLIPLEGISMKITFRANSEVFTPISSMNINVCKGKVTVTQNDKIQEPELPMIENRFIIEPGPCPIGYFKLFRFCIPINEDVSDMDYSDELEENGVE